MEWSASIFATGSHRHILGSPISLAGNKGLWVSAHAKETAKCMALVTDTHTKTENGACRLDANWFFEGYGLQSVHQLPIHLVC
jgi:hypothetical protein